MTYLGMNIKFEICCVWLSGKFKWMLNSTSMGIHANFICDGGKISTEQVKQKALLMIRQILLDRLEEVDLQLEEYSA